jgi:hypothetical protein
MDESKVALKHLVHCCQYQIFFVLNLPVGYTCEDHTVQVRKTGAGFGWCGGIREQGSPIPQSWLN